MTVDLAVCVDSLKSLYVLLILSLCFFFSCHLQLFHSMSPHALLIFIENFSMVGIIPLVIHRTFLYCHRCLESNFQINLLLQ